MNIKHKVTKKLSQTHSETVEAECVCGWYYRLGTYSIHSKSMRKVRQELDYIVRDHLEEAQEAAAQEAQVETQAETEQPAVAATKATPAVMEYQVLSALVNRRIEENSSLESFRFWMKLYHERGTEIANRYGVELLELVDAWVSWTEAIDAERAAVKVGA